MRRCGEVETKFPLPVVYSNPGVRRGIVACETVIRPGGQGADLGPVWLNREGHWEVESWVRGLVAWPGGIVRVDVEHGEGVGSGVDDDDGVIRRDDDRATRVERVGLISACQPVVKGLRDSHTVRDR